jgi:hypothetical protein
LENSVPSIDEETSVAAYFTHVQGVVPMLDEAEFRHHWELGERCDRPWLALLNMVLVMGSISAGDSNDQSHHIYYMRAKKYLDLELLGTGCVESLQAFCLLGGCYLHYKNSPNMADTIRGAAYRIAVGLGLHREHETTTMPSKKSESEWRLHMRRRIWWSLFCLDSWGCMTLGRPTLGRWDTETMNVSNFQDDEMSEEIIVSLSCSQRFCLIATRVQHRFAQISPISIAEIKDLDLQLKIWHEGLPAEIGKRESCPESLLSAHYLMQNRYFNLRLLLYRPVLLSYANSRVPFHSLQEVDQAAIQQCQEIASAAVNQITFVLEAISSFRVWNAVWYLYQASMVLVLSLLVDHTHNDSWKWRASIEKALELFDIMAPWAKAADRSKHVLSSIYEACGVFQESHLALGYGEFDVTVWDQLGIDPFADDWNWDPPEWANDAL